MQADRDYRNRPSLLLNRIARHQKREESQFRVHFYLMNVYYDSFINAERFVQLVGIRIDKIVKLAILQIYNKVDQNHVDLTVGLENDVQAAVFLISNKRIWLPAQNNELKEYSPVISSVFKSYINKFKNSQSNIEFVKIKSLSTEKRQDSKRQDVKRQDVKRQKSPYQSQIYMRRNSNRHDQSPQVNLRYSPSHDRRHHYRAYNRTQSKNRRSDDSPDNRSRSRSRSYDKHRTASKRYEQQVYFIWLFCIPLEYRDKQIEGLLAVNSLRWRRKEWKFKEDVEYLQVELEDPVSQELLASMNLKIDGYPIIVMAKRQYEGYLMQEMGRFQMEVVFDKDQDQLQLIKEIKEIDDVIIMIKDQYFGPKRYIVAFNSKDKAKLFQEKEREKKNCRIHKPNHPIRLGRVEKYFTFSYLYQSIINDLDNESNYP